MSARVPKPAIFSERRRVPRFPLRQGLTVKWPDPGAPSWGGEPEVLVQPATCRDVSATGVFLWVQRAPHRAAEVEVLMQAPPEMVSGEALDLTCRGRVIRIESDLHHHDIGLAIVFDRVDTRKRVA